MSPEAWQMTREQYARWYASQEAAVGMGKTFDEKIQGIRDAGMTEREAIDWILPLLSVSQECAVEEAIASGFDVPAHVLADHYAGKEGVRRRFAHLNITMSDPMF